MNSKRCITAVPRGLESTQTAYVNISRDSALRLQQTANVRLEFAVYIYTYLKVNEIYLISGYLLPLCPSYRASTKRGK